MRKHKKIIIIAVAAVLVIGATLAAVAFVQADTPTTTTPSSTANTTSLLDTVAQIYKQNTGTTIDSAQLQKAFTQAQQQLASQALDNMLQKLVTSGKITQQQATDYKNWLNSKPSTVISDQYKQWLQSKPQGVPFGPGMPAPAMPRGFGGVGKMFHR